MTWGSGAEAVKFDEPPARFNAQSAQRAEIVATSPAEGQSATRERPAGKSRSVTQAVGDHVAAVRSGAHVTGQLPSLKGQHARVHEAAAEWEHWVLKCGRIAWGYFHLALIKAPLNVVEWSTATFPRFVITVVLGLLAWKFH